MIKDKVAEVKDTMARACKIAGRNSSEVSLIAVSKTKPVSMLLEAYEAGCRDFGENKVQELTDKYSQLPDDIRWHMIGHLQRNKVKYIVGKVFLIHSVDSLKLAEEISREAVKKKVTVNILVEINVAGICVKGLMTIAPYVENAEENRQYFVKLRQLCVDIKNKNIDNVSMDILSMGMTGDYAVAVEEGATYVRVGTGIFGDRNYEM